MKLTLLCYNDIQQRSVESTSSSLPFDTKDKHLETPPLLPRQRSEPIVSTNASEPINRTTIEIHRRFVQRQNHEQRVLNVHLLSSTGPRYVLLVQVHKRVMYLKKFIEMLEAVETINQTLVIFSHDFIDPDINALVTNISFVPVMVRSDRSYSVSSRLTDASSTESTTEQRNAFPSAWIEYSMWSACYLGDSNLLSIFSTTVSGWISWSWSSWLSTWYSSTSVSTNLLRISFSLSLNIISTHFSRPTVNLTERWVIVGMTSSMLVRAFAFSSLRFVLLQQNWIVSPCYFV